MPDAADPYADQKLKAAADIETAKARAEAAAADLAEANARKADADARASEATAHSAQADANAKEAVADQTAKAAADKATADAQNSAAITAKAVADADKAAADARTTAAQATTAEAKAGIPDVPTLPKVENPEDKSVSVQDTGGAGTAAYTAAQALEGLGEDVGLELAWALGTKQDKKPRRYRDPRFEAMGIPAPDAATATPDPPDTSGTGTGAAGKKTVWIMDAMTPSEAGIVLLELRARLTAFTTQLNETLPLPKEAPKKGPAAKVKRLLDEIESRDLAVMAATGGLPGAALAAGGWAISTAGGLVNFGVQLVSALRSKYALYGRQVTLNRQALLSSVAGVLIGAGVAVRWPRFSSANTSRLIDEFTAACTARDALDARLPGTAPTAEPAKTNYDRAKKLIDRFDVYAASVLTAPTTGGQSPFLEAALFEVSLPPAAADREDILFYCDISAQGADAITGYGVAKGSTASFVGFVQAYFAATTRDGNLVWAGTSTVHSKTTLNLATGDLLEGTSSDE